MRLKGKRALVTGGSRSIGRAIAEGLAAEGAAVAVNYRAHAAEAEAVAAAIQARGGRAFAVQADTSVRSDVERMVARTVEALGGIDLLVNNAGVLTRRPFLDLPEPDWDWIMAVNVKGCFLVGQAVARQMVAQGGGGVIINITSGSARRASPNLSHYATSKAAVAMLTQAMALELAPHGIRVNAVGPGLIETDMNRSDLSDPAFREYRLGRIPLRVIGRPEDVVGGVVYLASDEARLATGTTLYLDGGSGL